MRNITKNLHFSLLLLFLLLSSSCIYVDVNENFVTVPIENLPIVSMESSLTGNDSIELFDSLLFSYTLIGDTASFIASEIFFGSVFWQSTRTSDSLWLYPSMTEVLGNFDLRMFAYSKSNTGSLADIYDAEFVQHDTSITITIYSSKTE